MVITEVTAFPSELFKYCWSTFVILSIILLEPPNSLVFVFKACVQVFVYNNYIIVYIMCLYLPATRVLFQMVISPVIWNLSKYISSSYKYLVCLYLSEKLVKFNHFIYLKHAKLG